MRVLKECGRRVAAEGGDSRTYRADIIKGDRPLHMLHSEFDTF